MIYLFTLIRMTLHVYTALKPHNNHASLIEILVSIHVLTVSMTKNSKKQLWITHMAFHIITEQVGPNTV